MSCIQVANENTQLREGQAQDCVLSELAATTPSVADITDHGIISVVGPVILQNVRAADDTNTELNGIDPIDVRVHFEWSFLVQISQSHMSSKYADEIRRESQLTRQPID